MTIFSGHYGEEWKTPSLACGAQGQAKIGGRHAVSLAIKDFQEDMHSIFSIVDWNQIRFAIINF
jgi:hypothetical protein